MVKYKALKDFYSGSLNKMVLKGEEVELHYSYDEIKAHFGEDYVEQVASKRGSKASTKNNVEKGEE